MALSPSTKFNTNIKGDSKNSSRKTRKPKRSSTRSKPLYDNCIMVDQNGQFLCNCSRKKIDWYLERKLAVLINENPVTVKLFFTPKGIGNRGNAFYESEKSNWCVVCGATNDLLRHNVIPAAYRQHFPLHIKSHSSHDVVLLCTACHRLADSYNHHLKLTLSNEYDIPLEKTKKNDEETKTRARVKSAGTALLNGSKIPEERKEVLHKILQEYYKKEEITTEDLKNAARLANSVGRLPREERHGSLVVAQLIVNNPDGSMDLKATSDKIYDFCRRWRQHFLTSLQPKYMSPYWDVGHRKPNDPY